MKHISIKALHSVQYFTTDVVLMYEASTGRQIGICRRRSKTTLIYTALQPLTWFEEMLPVAGSEMVALSQFHHRDLPLYLQHRAGRSRGNGELVLRLHAVLVYL